MMDGLVWNRIKPLMWALMDGERCVAAIARRGVDVPWTIWAGCLDGEDAPDLGMDAAMQRAVCAYLASGDAA